MQLFKAKDKKFDLAGSVLVLPAVAFANIGELAIDVLICTLKAELAARLDDENLLACVGNNAYSPQPPGLIATAAELYQVPGTKLFLLQQRAPAIPGRQKAFADNLAHWVKEAGVAHVLLLCALDAQYRRERQLEGTQLRFLDSSSSSSSGGGGLAAAAVVAGPSSSGEATGQQQQQLEAASSSAGAAGTYSSCCRVAGLLQLEQEVIETEREVHGLLPPWPILDSMSQQGLAHTLLATFAAEGDNVQEGMVLAAKVLGVLQLQGLVDAGAGAEAGSTAAAGEVVLPALQVPCSWVGGLYGRTFDKTLF